MRFFYLAAIITITQYQANCNDIEKSISQA